jgi:LmbE family N-acetylglucosaminyl deacetylase
LPRVAPGRDAPVALLLSPHPDDEVLSGGLALRLMREAGWRVLNVAITLGSNEARQAERRRELDACCSFIGFELVAAAPGGVGPVSLQACEADRAGWAARVEAVATLIEKHAPRAIFFPHAEDWNTTHVGTHQLVVDALARLGPTFRTYAVETEYWGAAREPNLLVELGASDVADLVAALGFHVGEVGRNPYHVTLPAQLIDAVRRGGELVLGQGRPAPAFSFASLYRLRRWQDGGFAPALAQGRTLSIMDDVRGLLPGDAD